MSCKSAKEITQLIETILDREWSKENDEGGNVITHNKDIFFSASPSPASPSSSSSSTSWWWFNYEEIGQRDSKHLREHGMVEEHIPTHIHTHVLYLYIVFSLLLSLCKRTIFCGCCCCFSSSSSSSLLLFFSFLSNAFRSLAFQEICACVYVVDVAVCSLVGWLVVYQN